MVKLKRVSQLIFLILFIALIFTEKIQSWMAIFFAGVIAAAILGRFYCGWICPTNTLTEGIESLYKKLNIKRRKVPDFIKNTIFKYGMLLIFIGTMIFVLATGKKLPVLPLLTALGLLASMFFVSSMWHRYLCPYGTILGITGKISKYSLKVSENECVKCGACYKACPAEAVLQGDKKEVPQIKSGLCLECLKCVRICPKKAIKFH